MTPWDWNAFRGTAAALAYNRRDLPGLEAAIANLPRRRVAVQAGGHLGIYPKKLAEEFRTVYTFEPDPRLFAMLVHNAPEPNIIKLQAALGASRRLVGLSRARRDGSGRPEHEGLTHVEGPGPYPTLLVDDLGLDVCDLLALDIEGGELEALEGALTTIERCRPALLVEINKQAPEPDALRARIERLGYRFTARYQSDEFFEAVA